MKTVMIQMSERELKRYESFKKAEKIVHSIKRSVKQIDESNAKNRPLKSARELINEI